MKRFLLPLPLLLLAACGKDDVDVDLQLQAAQKLLSAKDYDAAYAEYRRIAEEEQHPLAHFTLGLFHRLGWGRPENHAVACDWFEKAAAGRVPGAEHYYAEALLAGVHRRADPARALRLFRSAAEGGYHLSYYAIANMYFAGHGVAKDVNKGMEYCLRAASHGVRVARLRAGRMYFEGKEIPQDYGAAHIVFREASRENEPEADYYLGRMEHDGLGCRKDPVAAALSFERAASRGYLPAYLPLAELLLGEPGTKPPADRLAKAYLWASAAKIRCDEAGKKRAARLLERVHAIMPESWRKDLDARVAVHLAEFSG